MDIKLFYHIRDPGCNKFMTSFKEKVYPKLEKYSVRGVSIINLESLSQETLRTLGPYIVEGKLPFAIIEYKGSKKIYHSKEQILDFIYLKVSHEKEKAQKGRTNKVGAKDNAQEFESFNMLEYSRPSSNDTKPISDKETILGGDTSQPSGPVYKEDQFRSMIMMDRGKGGKSGGVSKFTQLNPGDDGAVDAIDAKFANDSIDLGDSFNIHENLSSFENYDEGRLNEHNFMRN